MASISAFGYLPSSPPLTGASSSTNRCRTTVTARLPDRTDDFSPLRSSGGEFDRRKLLVSSVGLLIGALVCDGAIAEASQFADICKLDLRVGTGRIPKKGEKVVVDWDGYTIGYYGRIFEARNKTKGGSFEGDEKEFFKFTLGSNEVIPAFEEAVSGMALGGIRRLVVPPELGYPENDYNKSGPRPTTFSVSLPSVYGQRALDFVLRNQGLIDKTLLFDVELLKIVPN
ncbi:hypothetical protein Bca4012_024284 [Brassica carinata]